nr:Chain C, VP35 [Sudan ebolavirus]
ATAAATEAY